MNNILSKETLQLFGEDYVKELTKQLLSHGKKASGKLIKSLDHRVKAAAEFVDIMIEGEDYLEYVDRGRKRGSFPPLQAIAKWTNIKGIAPEAVYPIARSIWKFGIKPTNVLDKAERNFYNSPSFKKFEERSANDIEIAIHNTIEYEIKKLK